MSVIIVGGNECMVRQYKELCREYSCRPKVFTHLKGSLKTNIGTPDLLVLFTSTMSHKMARCVLSQVKGGSTVIARSHTSSIAALKAILNQHVGQEGSPCQKNC